MPFEFGQMSLLISFICHSLVALAERRAVLEHDVRALRDVVAAVDPAAVGRRDEAHRDVAVGAHPALVGEQAVLEHPGAFVLQLEDVEIVQRVELAGRRVLRLEDLRELVVRHRRGRLDLPLEERDHVERLVEDLDALVVLGIHAVLRQRGVELELVSAAPHADRLASHGGDRRYAGRLLRDLRHARAREHLRDVHEVRARVARREQARQPVEADLRLSARHDLFRRDARPTELERHVEAERLVVAECLGGVVAGELRLCHPLELQGDLVELCGFRLRLGGAEACPQ